MSSLRTTRPSKSPLRPLSLEPVVPQQLSSLGHVLSAIKRIDGVRVVRNHDQPSSDDEFVVEVFSGRLRSRIPTLNNHGPATTLSISSAAPRGPTSTATKSLDDFADLRQRLCRVVRKAHKAEQCDFCRDMIKYALWGNAQPGAVARLFGDDDSMLQSLAKFLSDLVPMIESGCSTAVGGTSCRARTKLPCVVYDFFFGPGSECI